MGWPQDGRCRAFIEQVRPAVDCGRAALKRVLGDSIDVEADVITEGHEQVACVLLHASAASSSWSVLPMAPLGDDRWAASFTPAELGRHRYTVAAWIDAFLTWWHKFMRRSERDDVVLALREGAALVRDAANRARGAGRGALLASVSEELGTLEDFAGFRREAERLGLEIALDLAFQCSPDHPYVREHPLWFARRPDGSVQYAENPPKKYEDILPLDFGSAEWRELWQELRDVVEFWIGAGVRAFRVDNPHTKPFSFWRWLLTDISHEWQGPRVFVTLTPAECPVCVYRIGARRTTSERDLDYFV